jgi:hypothetical protein
MLLKIAAAMLLSLGLAEAAEPVAQLRGESAASFQCRSAYIPAARQCIARCDVAFASAEQELEQFECTQACATRSLYAMSACRAAGGAQTALASR